MKRLDKILIIVVSSCVLIWSFNLTFRISNIHGKSMFPTLINNEIVLCLTQFYPSNLTNYIVAFQYNQTITAMHRVIADNGTHILPKGDNNCCPDGWYSKDKLIGWLVWHTLQGLPSLPCPTCP